MLLIPHQDFRALGYLRTVESEKEQFGLCSMLVALACCLPPPCGYLFWEVVLLLPSMEGGASQESDILCYNGCNFSVMTIKCHFPNWVYEFYLGCTLCLAVLSHM